MKNFIKLLIPAIVLSLTFTSCNTDEPPNNEEVRKLPSKMIEHRANFSIYTEYFYDEQNRLIKIIRTAFGEEPLIITYNEDLPAKIIGMLNWADVDIIYQNNGKTIILTSPFQDTFWLNDKGQYTKLTANNVIMEFVYDSDGNTIKMSSNGTEIVFNISDTPSMFRHVNTPDWLKFWLLLRGNGLVIPFVRNLPLGGNYVLDANNYVIKFTADNGVVFEFEYILAH